MTCQLLIDQVGGKTANWIDHEVNTALYYAIGSKDQSNIALLKGRGYVGVSVRAFVRCRCPPPLIRTILENNIDLAIHLVQLGADVDVEFQHRSAIQHFNELTRRSARHTKAHGLLGIMIREKSYETSQSGDLTQEIIRCNTRESGQERPSTEAPPENTTVGSILHVADLSPQQSGYNVREALKLGSVVTDTLLIGKVTRFGKFTCLDPAYDDLMFGCYADIKHHYDLFHAPDEAFPPAMFVTLGKRQLNQILSCGVTDDTLSTAYVS
jgi:hypothetical protein